MFSLYSMKVCTNAGSISETIDSKLIFNIKFYYSTKQYNSGFKIHKSVSESNCLKPRGKFSNPVFASRATRKMRQQRRSSTALLRCSLVNLGCHRVVVDRCRRCFLPLQLTPGSKIGVGWLWCPALVVKLFFKF
ncbi:hypothetical protein T4D_16114 [Trichinella pseudospiralis]|uniref:Uncharacterized protein n=1 Tax=Trichinella pseudospiralis TaxID=6337 RepID=A0A0V1FAE9_TRIPS|nr:hypothetical protein T4D_16114 [Trichinella pseudospiralis]